MIFNAYPDSIGGNLRNCLSFLQNPKLRGIFSRFYILPSVFNSDMDRGFSVIDYGINEAYATIDDLEELQSLGIKLKLDFVLNHASVQSKQFQDILAQGEESVYKDFFIDWNKFWEGFGSMSEMGYIEPDTEYLKDMFFRKPGLPLLMVEMPDGTKKPYWNTFYQEIISPRNYLGQMDLNIRSPLVWKFYAETLEQLSGYGAQIVRLDAFAYAPKEPGTRNFLNEPATWDLLGKVRTLADKHNLQLLPEIHAEYREKIHLKLAKEGYLLYDFFLPGLIIHAIEKHTCEYLLKWANDIMQENLQTVNMLGCHDGIPMLDLRGLLPEDEIDETIKIITERGGYVKNVEGSKQMYYQVNATYFSALGESTEKMLLARALQLFMPGIPQIWYLDLLGGVNDHDAVRRAGQGGHKEINRTNLSLQQAEESLGDELVTEQLSLMAFRNTHPAFKDGAVFTARGDSQSLTLEWNNDGYTARLEADLKKHEYTIESL